MKVTLWYRYHSESDCYKYNHLQDNGHFENDIPVGSTKKNHETFKKSKWLKKFAYLRNKKVYYKEEL